MLTDSQKSALEHTHGPALILAVPGSGKTTVLINRIDNLINKHGVDPRRILSITFSRQSANDMSERYYKNFSSPNVYFSTIHSFCYYILRDYSYEIRKKFRLIEDNTGPMNKYNILRNIYKSYYQEPITEDRLELLLNSIGYVTNMMIYPEDLKLKGFQYFPEIYREYELFKRENDLIDFDDMLKLSHYILRNNEKLFNKYANMYDFIQVDEGQDTSKLQLEIIKLLAKRHRNIFIVADDDQSIYGFRGAYPEGLFKFKEEFPDAKLFFMEENFRSSKNIVAISNKLIRNNSNRFSKNSYTNNDTGLNIDRLSFINIEDQYQKILRSIEDEPNRNIAILYRNNISGVGISSFLKDNNIDFAIRDGNLKFFNHWVIKDVFNFLRFSKDITNLDIYREIYYKTNDYISKKQINYIDKILSTSSVFKRLKDYPGISRKDIEKLNSLELKFKKLSRLSPREAIDFIYYDLDYFSYLDEFTRKFGYNKSTILRTLEALKIIAGDVHTIDQLEDKIEDLKNYSLKSKKSDDKVFLSTIHSSKGLEFDSVYIIDLIDGEFPSNYTIDGFESGDFENLEEERRLFYVAMTRARNRLKIFEPGSKKFQPSIFLNEIK